MSLLRTREALVSMKSRRSRYPGRGQHCHAWEIRQSSPWRLKGSREAGRSPARGSVVSFFSQSVAIQGKCQLAPQIQTLGAQSERPKRCRLALRGGR